MAVAAPGYMAVIVDFPGLVAPSGQADPSTNGPDILKLSGSSIAAVKEVAVIAPTPGIE